MAASNGSTGATSRGTIGLNGPIFALIPEAGNRNIRDELVLRLGHLGAMLEITYGHGAETFQGWAGHLQDDYMWACATLAKECAVLADGMELSGAANARETA